LQVKVQVADDGRSATILMPAGARGLVDDLRSAGHHRLRRKSLGAFSTPRLKPRGPNQFDGGAQLIDMRPGSFAADVPGDAGITLLFSSP